MSFQLLTYFSKKTTTTMCVNKKTLVLKKKSSSHHSHFLNINLRMKREREKESNRILSIQKRFISESIRNQTKFLNASKNEPCDQDSSKLFFFFKEKKKRFGNKTKEEEASRILTRTLPLQHHSLLQIGHGSSGPNNPMHVERPSADRRRPSEPGWWSRR